MKCFGLIFCILCSLCLELRASKILFIAPVGTKSHFSFFGPLVNVLAERGHHVTLFKSYETKLHPNVTSIDTGIAVESLFPNTFEDRKWASTYSMMGSMPTLCVEALVQFQRLGLRMKDYDLVMLQMVACECFYSIIDEEVPLILVSPNTIMSAMHDYVGNIQFPAFVPTIGLNLNYPMSFWARFGNAVFTIPYYGILLPMFEKRHLEKCHEAGLCQNMEKPLLKKAYHASLAILNNVRALENPARPYVPSVVHAGGLHTKSPNPLPEDLKSWMEGAGEAGVIYFSLGTVVKMTELPAYHIKTLTNVFKSMPQRILWKSDIERIDDLPPNVKLASWLPQQDVLGHPNVRLFITHGGLFGITEAIYHAVPILGLPVFADQESNVLYAVHDGIGESIEWDDLTEEFLKQKLDMLLGDKKYKDTVQHRSELMKDQPMSPQETVVYWTEYVIRHKGAKHLRSPVLDMTWIEVYNIDVWATALAIAVAFLALVLLLLRCLLRFVARKCFGMKDKNKKLD